MRRAGAGVGLLVPLLVLLPRSALAHPAPRKQPTPAHRRRPRLVGAHLRQMGAGREPNAQDAVTRPTALRGPVGGTESTAQGLFRHRIVTSSRGKPASTCTSPSPAGGVGAGREPQRFNRTQAPAPSEERVLGLARSSRQRRGPRAASPPASSLEKIRTSTRGGSPMKVCALTIALLALLT